MNVFFKIADGINAGELAFGTVGNTLSLIICTRPNLRKYPTFVFLAFMAVTDFVCLFIQSSYSTYNGFFGGSFTSASSFLCKTFLFFQNISLFSSANILVLMSVERCLSVAFRPWKRMNFNTKKAAICSVLVVVVAIALYSHAIVESTYIEPVQTLNSTRRGKCVYTKYVFTDLGIIGIAFNTIIPFVIIGIANIILVIFIIRGSSKKIQRNDEEKARRRAISVSIITITAAFVVLRLPMAVLTTLGFEIINTTEWGGILSRCVDIAFIGYYSANFVFLMVSNKQYAREFKALFGCLLTNKSAKTQKTETTKSTAAE